MQETPMYQVYYKTCVYHIIWNGCRYKYVLCIYIYIGPYILSTLKNPDISVKSRSLKINKLFRLLLTSHLNYICASHLTIINVVRQFFLVNLNRLTNGHLFCSAVLALIYNSSNNVFSLLRNITSNIVYLPLLISSL